MEKISVVIPVYNSAASIEQVVYRLIQCFESKNQEFEIILVDDCSRDNSREILTMLSDRDERLQTYFLEANHGQQETLKYGIMQTRGNYIITIDDDLEQQPEDIFLLINEIQKGFDVVYGVAMREGYAFHRQLGSNLVDLFFTLFLKKPRHLRVSSFRIMNRSVAETIAEDTTDFVYLSAIILKNSQNIANVQVSYQKRPYGQSNYDVKKLLKLYVRLVYYYGIN
ncbi:glycosyltransferase [Eubacteriaceae bacterium ES3]|nr:glycosyltransferase [Eubacteriaceae bacterium ES3]